MKNFFNKKSSGGWKNGSNQGGRSAMHRATCGKCNAPCEVPFKPNGRKPVLCSDCFRKDGGGSSSDRQGSPRRSDRRDSFDKPSYRSTPRDNSVKIEKELKALNAKMDQILEALTDFEQETDEDEKEMNGDENFKQEIDDDEEFKM